MVPNVVGPGSKLRRMALALSLALLPICGAFLAPGAVAEPPSDRVVEGSFMVGRPQPQAAVCFGSKPSVSCGIHHGLDLYVFQVDPDHQNHWFWVNGTAFGFHNLDIYFFDAIDRPLTNRATNAANEQGRIPYTAAYAVVTSHQGYDVGFRFVVSPYE